MMVSDLCSFNAWRPFKFQHLPWISTHYSPCFYQMIWYRMVKVDPYVATCREDCALQLHYQWSAHLRLWDFQFVVVWKDEIFLNIILLINTGKQFSTHLNGSSASPNFTCDAISSCSKVDTWTSGISKSDIALFSGTHTPWSIPRFVNVAGIPFYMRCQLQVSSNHHWLYLTERTCSNNSATLLAKDGKPVPFHVCL